jgi:hypothetical protein
MRDGNGGQAAPAWLTDWTRSLIWRPSAATQ